MPTPDVVIGDGEIQAAAPGKPVSEQGIAPSRQRERQSYDATPENCAAVEAVCDELLAATELEYEISFDHGDYHRVQISLPSSSAGALIGRRGASIDALELLMGRMASQRSGGMVPIQVDVNEYRAQRETELREDAKMWGERVLESKEDHHFPAMHGRERRIVHITVKAMGELETYTLGEGASRHVVISHSPGREAQPE
jgi:spoIIIJ-associated protein